MVFAVMCGTIEHERWGERCEKLDWWYTLNVDGAVVESVSLKTPGWGLDAIPASLIWKLVSDLAQLLQELDTNQRLGEATARFLMRFTTFAYLQICERKYNKYDTQRRECLAPLVPLYHRFRDTSFLPGFDAALARLFQYDAELIDIDRRAGTATHTQPLPASISPVDVSAPSGPTTPQGQPAGANRTECNTTSSASSVDIALIVASEQQDARNREHSQKADFDEGCSGMVRPQMASTSEIIPAPSVSSSRSPSPPQGHNRKDHSPTRPAQLSPETSPIIADHVRPSSIYHV